MSRPRFSIVIPTRMRHTTLPFTLRTCLAQSFSDYEIVVADNASLPATRAAVEACESDKIRYFYSAEALPMSVNWTRAVGYARGEWILLLGDDDALLPWSLTELNRLVSQYSTRSVCWEMPVYTWPCVGVEDQRSRLQLPLGSHVRLVKTQPRLAKMLRSPHFVPIPLPYHGLIHRSLFEQALESGPIFEGPCPDTFAGIFLASLTPQFLEVGTPMSLVGVSGKSNGLQGVIEDSTGATYRDFVALNDKANIRFHEQLPQLPMMPVIILDGLLRTRDRLGLYQEAATIKPLEIASHCLDGLWQVGEERQRLLHEIERVLPDDAARVAFRSDRRYATPHGSRPSAVYPLGMHRGHVVLNADELGIADVSTASELAARLLNHPDKPISYRKSRSRALKQMRGKLTELGYDLSKFDANWQQKLAAWSARKLRSVRKRWPWSGRRAA